ncbi:MAG TPA: agmatine deiminase family protein [Bacteroidales bacterium]|nr:agmatine deiminase family protein [Bacteroidales bacterium]HPI31381.1 agmatine deiminase family protein [Bacteroidales bacterium]
MKKVILSLFAVSLLISWSYAQHAGSSAPYEFQARYHMLDSSELYVPKIAGKAFTATAPPTGTVRAIAEWEPAQAVLVCAYSYGGQPTFGIPYSLIAEMSETYKVITMVESSAHQTTVTNNYTNNAVNLSNCSFIIAPLDSYWARDFSPWFIMTNNNTVAIIDFPYNRPSRPNDDNVPVVMSTYLTEPLYGMNVMHTGGNYMCDGMGVAVMTDLVLDENSLTHAQIDTAFKQYMGIVNNYITTDPLNDYIKHVDCWGKFLDVDKILIASVPTNNAQYTEYEAMAAYWANEISSYGNHYQVYRVYEPNGQPYTNSIILNNKVLVPVKGGTSASYDNAALAVYQDAMPGYEILGFTQLSSAPWQSTDALHCRAHEIADKGMLYINHMPLLGEKTVQSQYPVTAGIYAVSGSSIIADSVYLKYKVYHGSWGAWTKINMTNTAGNIWTANIPQQMAGDTILYYIHAADQSPRNVNHPLIGQPDPHRFYINGTATTIENYDLTKAIVFPNPATDFLFVQMQNTGDAETTVLLTDLTGKQVKYISEKNLDTRMLRLDISSLPAGTYFLSIHSGDFLKNQKIMVIH